MLADLVLNPEGGKTCVVDPTLADFDEERISSFITLTIATKIIHSKKARLGAHRKPVQAVDFPRFSAENAAPCRETRHFKSKTN